MIIVRSNPAVGLRGERPTRHMTAAPHAGGGCRQTNIAERGGADASSAICPPVPFVRNAETAVGRASINLDEQGKNGRQSPEFVRGLRAPGALITARVQPRKQALRRFTKCLHVSFGVSVHECQTTTGAGACVTADGADLHPMRTSP